MPKAKKKPTASKPPGKIGRPTTYSEALADRICLKLSEAYTSIAKVCEAEDMPCAATVYGWLDKYPAFLEKYQRARQRRADAMVFEILEIADDGRNDTYLDEDGNTVVNYDHIQRSKLRVDARKWLASKFDPKKYSEKIQQEVTGGDGGPLQVFINLPHNGR